MQRCRYSSALRLISTVVLTLFAWTSGGIFSAVHAAVDSQKVANSRQDTENRKKKEQKPEEKFQKAIEDIEQTLSDTVTSTDTKKDKLKTKTAEINLHDTEIKKQFTETEKKLKESNLPQEILNRHYSFVKKYEENLTTLKTHLSEIDKAKTEAEIKDKTDKAKAFLEKIKPPVKHTPLDPNKLPHRMPDVRKKEPRLKYSGQQSAISFQQQDGSQGELNYNYNSQPSAFSGQGKDNRQKTILLASNGDLTGLLPFSNPQPSTLNSFEFLNLLNSKLQQSAVSYQQSGERQLTSSLSIADSPSPVLLAQSSNPPTSADLSETIEVQLTPEIRAKAAELGYNPVKIYNWVRNNIEFIPTYGSIQGAQMTLLTKQGNPFDTASLLIALLRASNIHARYAYGTIELPIEKVMNWAGGFTDANAALDFIASGGIPVTGIVSGGKITSVRMEHIWVEAYIDYIPSRGARHKTGKGDTWIPLDTSFKQYSFTQGIDIKTAVPFDAQTFIDRLKSTAVINETEGYATGVNSTLIQQTMTNYQTQVQNYITQNYPNATVGDVLGKKDIIKQEFPYLLGTLPYRTVVKGAKYPEIPDNLRHKVTLNVQKDAFDETPINITKSLPEIAGKKITISYITATPQDEEVINSYLPKPHPDGTPIQLSELPTSLPAYLINLKPELRIDGQLIATGAPITMGNQETFTITFSAPEQTDIITNQITSGEYLAVAINTGRISKEQMIAIKTKLQNTKAKLDALDITSLSKDDMVGDLLHTTGIFYHAELGLVNYLTAKTIGVALTTMPSEAIVSFKLDTRFTFGIPVSVSAGGLLMDADRLLYIARAKDGNSEREKQHIISSGIISSALEHSIFEQFFSTATTPAEAVSAVKALNIANDQGIPIYTINQSNRGSILPQLQLNEQVKTDIINAVNAGKIVTAPKTNISFNGWTGNGYIITDPNTGAGAYMISEGANGARVSFKTSEFSGTNAFFLLINSLRAPMWAKDVAPEQLKGLGAMIGILSTIVSWLLQYQDLNDANDVDAYQWLSLFILISSFALLSLAIAILPFVPMLFGIALPFIGFFGWFLIGIIATYLFNVIKTAIVERIKNAMWYQFKRRRKIA